VLLKKECQFAKACGYTNENQNVYPGRALLDNISKQLDAEKKYNYPVYIILMLHIFRIPVIQSIPYR